MTVGRAGGDPTTRLPARPDAVPDAAVADRRAPAGQEARWHRIRKRALLGWIAAVVVLVATVGVPTDRGTLLLLIVSGLGIRCLGRGWAAFRRVLLDWLPFTAALVVYDMSRGVAVWIGMPLHMADIAAVDRTVFGVVPTVYLQGRFLDPGEPHWWDAAATLIYTTHFLATPAVAVALWLWSRRVWLKFVRRVIVLAVAGLVTYIVFPAAPPWYAANEGVIAPVLRSTSRGWVWLHLNKAGNLLREGQLSSNPVAAMPSLHTAYATVITLFVVSVLAASGRQWVRRARWAVTVYPFAMGLSLVYLGEHYVTDLVAGVAYAVATHVGVGAWERRHPPCAGADPFGRRPVTRTASNPTIAPDTSGR